MITQKQWIDFKKWRVSEHKRITSSKKWEELQKEMENINEKEKKIFEPRKRKFLGIFWEYEYERYPIEEYLINLKINTAKDGIFMLQQSLLSRIPPETVEGCLNWLTSKKGKVK